MASYTDQIPQFNPYVAQLPVEAMVAVGMEKQRRYDEGITKIQTQIDSIAGLDVVRDVDKNYLQSKINELGNKLKIVAAGDFSNYQLVNSVSGMTSQIVKDPNVQSAVYSTANHRKQLAAMEEARTKGALAPENEIDYQKQFNRYATSGKVGEQFNGKYTPYIDVNKKLYEIGKEVGLDEKTIPQLWQTDASGNILKDKDGLPIFNPVMAEKHLKGKDAGKLLAAFQAALTPADYNQLAITGRYQKGGLSPEQLNQEVKKNYTDNITMADGQIQNINLQLLKENAKNDKNKDLIKSLNEQKQMYENQKHTLQTSMQRDLETAITNPDAVRGNLYTNNYLSTMSRSLSTSTEETTYKVSPMFEVTMRQNEFNRQVQRDKISDQHWAIEQRREDRKELRESYKDQLELWTKYGIGTPPAGYTGTRGLDEPIPVADNRFAIVAAVEDGFSLRMAQLNDANMSITREYFRAMTPKAPGQTDAEYEVSLSKAMESYALANGMSIKSSPDEINKFAAEFASRQLESWKKDETSVPRRFRELISQQNDLTKQISVQQAKMSDIKSRATQQAKDLGVYGDYEKIKAKIQETTIKTSLGDVRLSKEDVIDFANLHPEVHNIFKHFTVDDSQKSEMAAARQRLQTKYGNRFAELEKRVYGIEQIVPGTEWSEAALNVNPVIDRAAFEIGSSNFGKLAEIEAQMYIDEGFLQQPKSFPVLRGKENEYDINSRLSAIVTKSGVDQKLIDEALTAIDKGASSKVIASPGMTSNDPTTYYLQVKGIKVQIDEGDYVYLTKNPPMRAQDKPQVLDQIDHWGTSGLNGVSEPGSAWFSSSDFKNLKGVDYTATGNLRPDPANPNNLWFYLTLHFPDGTTEEIEYDEPIPRINQDKTWNQSLNNLALGVTPVVIEQLRKSNKKK